MTRIDKIKNLTEDSIIAYDSRVNNQIDRIEKKNREQNHKISILTNELDNDYLSKTEESSVISLDHSKEGMVYIDELEGNTMVNYCTDGDRELILNDEIDLEGDFVTIDGTVDGGLVDIALEGNTLINLSGIKEETPLTKVYDNFVGNEVKIDGSEGEYVSIGNIVGDTVVNLISKGIQHEIASYSKYILIDNIKPNTNYTLIIHNIYENHRFGIFNKDASLAIKDYSDNNIITFNSSEFDSIRVYCRLYSSDNLFITEGSLNPKWDKVILLEGDYTDKPIPQEYFEGLKSSFEDKVNEKGKCEVSVKVVGKNLFSTWVKGSVTQEGFLLSTTADSLVARVESGKTYRITKPTNTNKERCVLVKEFPNKPIPFTDSSIYDIIWGNTFTVAEGYNYVIFYIQTSTVEGYIEDLSSIQVQIEEGTEPTLYEPYFSSKSTVYLNSPLLKGDEIVWKENKLWHLHKSGEVLLDGVNEQWRVGGYDNVNCMSFDTQPFINNVYQGYVVSDKFICNQKYSSQDDFEYIASITNRRFCININKLRLTNQTAECFAEWLSENPITVVYELAEPWYELLESELINEITNTSTLSLESNIPIVNTSFKLLTEYLPLLESNTEYRVTFNSDKNGVPIEISLGGIKVSYTTLGYNSILITTVELTDKLLSIDGKGCNIGNCMVTKGNGKYNYFEGMKSVGEVEDNKLEIVSNTSNLLDFDKLKNTSNIVNMIKEKTTGRIEMTYKENSAYPYVYHEVPKVYLKQLLGKKIFILANLISADDTVSHMIQCNARNSSGKVTWCTNGSIIPTDTVSLIIQVQAHNDAASANCASGTTIYDNIYVGVDKPNEVYQPYQSQLLSIQLQEPLRGLPYGIKDRFVKIGGQWYVERNCYNITFNGNLTEQWVLGNDDVFYIDRANWVYPSIKPNSVCLTNKYPMSNSIYDIDGKIYNGNSWVTQIRLHVTMNEWREELNRNPLTMIYQLENPTYEPITSMELSTYLDSTHVSNNSLIPCNMKVKNIGYNVIIKPNTLYTIALDANRNGTISIDLGGKKGVTYDNVLTLTTPNDINDSLRIYGKGIKSFKVRLLEGDRINWVPSYFEGMKSSFEENIQEDGSYKMEILSNNENLFDAKNAKIISTTTLSELVRNDKNGFTLTSVENHSGWAYTTINLPLKLKPNTQYIIRCSINKSNKDSKPCLRLFDLNKTISYVSLYNTESVRFTTPYVGCENIKMLIYSSIDNVSTAKGDTFEFNDIKISEIREDTYTEPKSNKIQFLLNEPLRKIKNHKDRLVLKNNKLMIERNCEEFVLDGVNLICSYMSGQSGLTTKYGQIQFKNNGIVSNLFAQRDCWFSDEEGMETNGNAIGFRIKNAKLDLTKSNPMNEYFKSNPLKVIYISTNPTYEELPTNLTKLILENYNNATLLFNTDVLPTVTARYSGLLPLIQSIKSNQLPIVYNTNDINDNIVPYMLDMDYRVIVLQLSANVQLPQTFSLINNLFDMLQRDVQSYRLPNEEYKHRINDYYNVGKLSEDEVIRLEELLNE